jgi:biotin synthase
MCETQIDNGACARIARLGQEVLRGEAIKRDDALWLLDLEDSADIMELLAWANRIRQKHHGRKVHLCSIVNVKSGGCPENCRFCAQSSFNKTEVERFGFIDARPILEAAAEAGRNKVTGLGIVAAWKGLEEGRILDEVCDRLRDMSRDGNARADASLGLIRSQVVADRLREAGCECYNHNLETSRDFYPQVCTTHSWEARVQTLGHLRKAGIKLCSGGIIGMGETRADRCDLAFALREQNPFIVPINILNPIPGTPFEKVTPMTPFEALKTIACFRFILPAQHITIAGGRVVNLRDIQPLALMGGASALMVGNYLTTVNQPVEKDLQMLKDLDLEPMGFVPAQG